MSIIDESIERIDSKGISTPICNFTNLQGGEKGREGGGPAHFCKTSFWVNAITLGKALSVPLAVNS